jgi:hypothetical protein
VSVTDDVAFLPRMVPGDSARQTGASAQRSGSASRSRAAGCWVSAVGGTRSVSVMSTVAGAALAFRRGRAAFGRWLLLVQLKGGDQTRVVGRPEPGCCSRRRVVADDVDIPGC